MNSNGRIYNARVVDSMPLTQPFFPSKSSDERRRGKNFRAFLKVEGVVPIFAVKTQGLGQSR
ncbi:hypothetical protein RAM80_15695 [Pseudomonas sp. App30]|uniref:hypothetical protein n=1 Tax=Pseudomonas sp. App30 TaxID=3068990 RepID=UPI003A80F57F